MVILKLPNIKILNETDKRLHQVSKEVKFPLTKEDKDMINDMLVYLQMSQIDEEREKYNLRAGWGMSAVQ